MDRQCGLTSKDEKNIKMLLYNCFLLYLWRSTVYSIRRSYIGGRNCCCIADRVVVILILISINSINQLLNLLRIMTTTHDIETLFQTLLCNEEVGPALKQFICILAGLQDDESVTDVLQRASTDATGRSNSNGSNAPTGGSTRGNQSGNSSTTPGTPAEAEDKRKNMT